EPRADSARPCASEALDHGFVRHHAGKQAVDEPLVLGDAQKRRELLGELILAQFPDLEPSQQLKRHRITAEELFDGALVETLRFAERGEALPNTRREHTSEIDKQSLHLAATRSRAYPAEKALPSG